MCKIPDEVSADLVEAVKEILEEAGFTKVRIIKDTAGKDRVAAAVWKK